MADKLSPNFEETKIIIDRLLAGDQSAWRTLVAEYAGLLLGICRNTFAGYGFAASRQDEEDVVAEVWGNILENNRRILHQCREHNNLPQTLFLITRRRAIDWIRAHRNPFLPLITDNLPQEPVDEPIPPAALSLLKDALNSLNSNEMTLLQLFFLQKKKYREIAFLTGIPQNSIGPTIGRALAKLRIKINVDGAIA